MQRGSPEGRCVSVAVVSDNTETLDGLERYLRDAGIAARGTRSLDQAWEMVTPSRSVVVLFPDDFPTIRVFAALAALRRRCPGARAVIVTKDYRRFASAEGAVVIPKPVWGFTILDAVRTRLELTE
jgi:DNA-binding NtrC family response regulator